MGIPGEIPQPPPFGRGRGRGVPPQAAQQPFPGMMFPHPTGMATPQMFAPGIPAPMVAPPMYQYSPFPAVEQTMEKEELEDNPEGSSAALHQKKVWTHL